VILDETSLRRFLGRIIGWSAAPGRRERAPLGPTQRRHSATLVLLGDTDLVPIAQELHRRAVGAEPPFVVYDRRRPDRRETFRARGATRAAWLRSEPRPEARFACGGGGPRAISGRWPRW
jgi:hypothetical protein